MSTKTTLERALRAQTDALARVLNNLAGEWETEIANEGYDANVLDVCVRQLRAVASHGLGLAESDPETPCVDVEPSQVSSDLHVVCTVFFDAVRGTGMSTMSDGVAVVWTCVPARASLCGLFVVRVSRGLLGTVFNDYLHPLAQERHEDWPSAAKGYLSMPVR